jgi:bifunctional DNA-binding transcriptional regulator/antitoxin component of YhaV-PrlF toxin-antitoxin module
LAEIARSRIAARPVAPHLRSPPRSAAKRAIVGQPSRIIVAAGFVTRLQPAVSQTPRRAPQALSERGKGMPGPKEIRVISADGRVEIPGEVERTLRLRQGARVRLSVENGVITLRPEISARPVDDGRPRWTDIRPAYTTEREET